MRRVGGKGYTCGYTLLNAALYGVPQMRERMFLIGYRRELASPVRFPEPTHSADLPPGYRGSRAVALKILRTYSLGTAHNYLSPPNGERDLPPAVTAYGAIGDLPVIDALAQFKSGQLRRGARRFDSPLLYASEARLSSYARAMKCWPGFEAPDALYDHVIRYLPRDFALFARMNSGDQYPEAHQHACQMFEERLAGRACIRCCAGRRDRRVRTSKAADCTPVRCCQVSQQMAQNVAR